MKAEGGYAAVCTEYCSIHPESDDTHRVSARLWDDDDIKNLGADVRHAPRARRARRRRALVRRPARAVHGVALRPARPLADPERLRAPHVSRYEMDKDDIREVQSFYVEAAKRARDGRLRHRLRLRLALLPPAAVPDAVLQQAHGRVRRLASRTARASGARRSSRCARRSATTARSPSACRPTCSWARPARSSSATACRSSSSSTTSSTSGTSTSPASPSGARTRRRRASIAPGRDAPLADGRQGASRRSRCSASGASRTRT